MVLMLGQCSGQDCEYTVCDGNKCIDGGDRCCDGWLGGTNEDHQCEAGWTRRNEDGDGHRVGGCTTFSSALGFKPFTCFSCSGFSGSSCGGLGQPSIRMACSEGMAIIAGGITGTCESQECSVGQTTCTTSAGSCTAGAGGRPCSNGGTTTGTTGNCGCSCAKGYSGNNCEARDDPVGSDCLRGQEGVCINVNTHDCKGADTLAGYCLGPAHVKCCPTSDFALIQKCGSTDVVRAYRKVLCREPDKGGLDNWTLQCETNPRVTKSTLEDLFRDSVEHRDCPHKIGGQCVASCNDDCVGSNVRPAKDCGNGRAASANDAKRGRRGRIAGGILGTLAVVMLSVGALLQKMNRSRRANTIPNLDLRQTHAAVHNQLFAAEIMADSDYTPAFETSVAPEGGHRRHDTILGVFNSMYGVSSELPARITVSSGNNALYAVPMEIAEDGQAAGGGGGGGGGRSSSISSATVSVASGNNTIYAVPMEMVGKANEEARRQQTQSKQLRLDAEGYVDDASVNQPQDVEYAIAVVDSTVEYAPSTELPSSTVYMYTEGEAAGLADDAEYIDVVDTFPYGTAAETDADGGGRGEGQTAVSTVYAIPMDGAAIGEEEAPCTDTALAVAAGVDVPAGSAAEYAEPNALYKSADDERSLNESTL
eukprot:gene3145-30986_t